MDTKKIMVLVLGIFFSVFVVTVANATIDLTIGPNIYTGITAGDGSIWRVIDTQPTGTGVIDPFLRLQNNNTEEGLNTDAKNPGVYDDLGSIYTHSVRWEDLALVPLNGQTYYQFTFDINEPAGGNPPAEYLSFDVFELFSGTSRFAESTTGLTLNYAFADTGGVDNGPPVLTNYLLASSGSGNDDIEVLIPTTAVTNPSDYMYLHVKMGMVGPTPGANYDSADGFEEVRVLLEEGTTPGGGPIPEPTTLLLLGFGLAGAFPFIRNRFRR